jgi:PIN domain nuclease of toxin-antitoxin system
MIKTSRYLLDTHVLLWFQLGELDKISKGVLRIIQEDRNEILFSQVSLFEIAIKQAVGKLPQLQTDTDEVYHQGIKDGFVFLPIQNDHISSYKKVPLFDQHHDPFDRMLIATAYEENATIITIDKNFKLYGGFVDIFW